MLGHTVTNLDLYRAELRKGIEKGLTDKYLAAKYHVSRNDIRKEREQLMGEASASPKHGQPILLAGGKAKAGRDSANTKKRAAKSAKAAVTNGAPVGEEASTNVASIETAPMMMASWIDSEFNRFKSELARVLALDVPVSLEHEVYAYVVLAKLVEQEKQARMAKVLERA